MTFEIPEEVSRFAVRTSLVVILWFLYQMFGFEDFIAMIAIAAFIGAQGIDDYLFEGDQ